MKAGLLAACAVVIAATMVGAQEPVPAVSAAPPAAMMTPDEHAALEPAVAGHLQSLQQSIEALVRSDASKARVAAAYGALGQAHHAHALMAPAMASYRAAHQLSPDDFRWPYLLACILQQDGRADEALSYYERARALRADYAPLAVRTGQLHLEQGRVDEARRAFEAALAIDASMAAARYGLGQVAMSQRDYARAVEHFSAVLTAAPDASRVHYVLALAHRGLGQMAQAQAHLRQQGPVGVRVADPLVDGLPDLVQGVRLVLLRGRLAFEAGRLGEAVDAFRKAVAADGQSVPARVNLGSALAQVGESDAAIEHLRRALDLDPDNRSALFNLGAVFAAINRPADAVPHLTRLVELAPDDHDARVALGRALLRAQRVEAGLAAFTVVADVDPGHEDALLGQVDALVALGRHREALEALDRANARFPTRGRTAARLASLLATSPQRDLRDYARALDLARRVYDATGAIGDGVVVAAALSGLGRCEEAVALERDLVDQAEQAAPTRVAALRAELGRALDACK